MLIQTYHKNVEYCRVSPTDERHVYCMCLSVHKRSRREVDRLCGYHVNTYACATLSYAVVNHLTCTYIAQYNYVCICSDGWR